MFSGNFPRPHPSYGNRRFDSCCGIGRGGGNEICKTIAILDGESEVLKIMIPLLRKHYPHLAVVSFYSAPLMIDWLTAYLDSCALISLNDDLGPVRKLGREIVDPGSGREVVEFLLTREPACSVILHAANSQAAPRMENALLEAGWNCLRVTPYEDRLWIKETWIEAVEKSFADR